MDDIRVTLLADEKLFIIRAAFKRAKAAVGAAMLRQMNVLSATRLVT